MAGNNFSLIYTIIRIKIKRVDLTIPTSKMVSDISILFFQKLHSSPLFNLQEKIYANFPVPVLPDFSLYKIERSFI